MKKRRESERRFRQRYSTKETDAALIVEREVIGGNVGANGYTTVAQADMLAERLELDRQTLLLDIGCGRGWPGLYLSEKTGCHVVLSDIPLPALRAAMRRAEKRRLLRRTRLVRASGTHPPFARQTFDAITHTDTL